MVFASDPTTIPDGETLFTICFKLVGSPGENTKISISDYPIEPEICGQDNQENTACNINLICKCGGIMIKDIEMPGKHGITNTSPFERAFIGPVFNISHNPHDHVINIELNNNESDDGRFVQILNTLGVEVSRNEMFESDMKIQTSGLGSGVYYIVVSRQGSIIQTKKFLKM